MRYTLLFLLILLAGCNSGFTPRPKGYAAIDFPPHSYRVFDMPGYPYKFEYPVYANVLKDSTFFDASPENPWWINIDYPQFNGRIYVSYKDLRRPGNDFTKMVNDAYNLSYKHSYKASNIEDSLMQNPNGVRGVMFHVAGDAATATQFFLSDTAKNFLRGALYFDTTPNEDSLRPVNDFIKEDLLHLIQTFAWK